jgi:hypothetical protein
VPVTEGTPFWSTKNDGGVGRSPPDNATSPISYSTSATISTVKSEWVPSGQPALKEPGGVLFRDGSLPAGIRIGSPRQESAPFKHLQ